jgi:hypothetical protein
MVEFHWQSQTELGRALIMLKLFSLFGYGCTASNYSKTTLKAALEHAVDRTDPWIRAVSGYKEKLRPASNLSKGLWIIFSLLLSGISRL